MKVRILCLIKLLLIYLYIHLSSVLISITSVQNFVVDIDWLGGEMGSSHEKDMCECAMLTKTPLIRQGQVNLAIGLLLSFNSLM